MRSRGLFVFWGRRSPILMPLVGVVLSLAVNGHLRAQTHAGQYEQADIAYRSSLYATYCVACHGADGDQMPGVNLRSGRFRNASSDRELRRVLTEGISGTAMIPGSYNDSELTALVAALRNMDVMPPNDLIHLAYFNAGVRVYDINDPYLPEEVGWFLPGDPAEPKRSQSGMLPISITQEVLVDTRGNIYAVDSAGIYVLRNSGELTGRWQ